MNLKQLIVVRPPEGLFEIWTRKEYDDYMTYTISAGAVPAYSIVTHFNEDERLTVDELKEDEYAAQFAGTREEVLRYREALYLISGAAASAGWEGFDPEKALIKIEQYANNALKPI